VFPTLPAVAECIYPATIRVHHRGAAGYTVSKALQAELFDNLRLSRADSTASLYNLANLHSPAQYLHYDNYNLALSAYVGSCVRVFSLSEIAFYRSAQLCLVIPAETDSDNYFNLILHGFLGVIGLGGHANYAAARGFHEGILLINHQTNILAIVSAKYTKFSETLLKFPQDKIFLAQAGSKSVNSSEIQLQLGEFHVGCFADSREARVLPFPAPNLAPFTPLRCILACQLLGYSAAGLEWGVECYCGAKNSPKLTQDKLPSDKCNSKCVNSWEEKQRLIENEKNSLENGPNSNSPTGCGGDFAISVYSVPVYSKNQYNSEMLGEKGSQSGAESQKIVENYNQQQLSAQKQAKFLRSPLDDSLIIKGKAGESCAAACSAQNSPLKCVDGLLSLISSDCRALKKLFGCENCVNPVDSVEGNVAPGWYSGKNECVVSRGRYLSCQAQPKEEESIIRACVCQKQSAE
jgi:hypothetical protein